MMDIRMISQYKVLVLCGFLLCTQTTLLRSDQSQGEMYIFAARLKNLGFIYVLGPSSI